MKQCTNCGAQLTDNATFCPECGTSTRFKSSQRARQDDRTRIMPDDRTQVIQDDRTQVFPGPQQQQNQRQQPYQQQYQQQYQHQPYQQPQPQYYPQPQQEKGLSQKTMIFILAGALLLAGLVIVLLLVRKPSTRVIQTADTPASEVVVTEVSSSGDASTTPAAPDAPAVPTVHKLHASVNDAMHIPRQGSNTYYAKNMLDGKPNTAWTVNMLEGTTPDGFYIDLLRFNINASKLDHVKITNGYAKSSERFHQNARAGYVEITRVPADQAGPADIIYNGPLRDSMSPQTFQVSSSYDNSRPTNTVYVRFSDLINGDKYPYDFCISEVQFYGIE